MDHDNEHEHEITPAVDEIVTVHVDKSTHDILLENDSDESVTIAVRPRMVRGESDAAV